METLKDKKLDDFYDEPQEWENPTLIDEKPQQENWESRFDKQFNILKYEQDGERHEGFRCSKVPNSKDVKAFISTERQKVIEEVREIIKNMNSTTHTPVGGYSNIEWLEKSTLLTALTKLGKDK